MTKRDLLNFIGDREKNTPTSRAHAIVSYCVQLTPIEIITWGEDVLEMAKKKKENNISISNLAELVRVRKLILDISEAKT